ncbi:unnamed protein product [Bursaphelenchus okinawaensis]|uniref:AAA+ ATPase domain-containing protein n=1 Tax=Bursaphelenchus okinawaensis TaxID=465554 RepID=A0A811JUD3_9BILA|nr:unnamed protein product [Bursaphelenchus okinawaensis]CAG9083480.1 unnamed protein product [Bursaphelenchus okinawaensis]
MSLRDEAIGLCIRLSAAAVITYFSVKYMVRLLDPNHDVKKEAQKKVQELLERLNIDFPVELNEYELRIATQLVTPDEGASWMEIGGHEEIIREIRKRVITPLKAKASGRLPNSTLFNPAKGILLYGPPGCGKTLIAKAVASDVEARFLHLDLSGLTDKWYGESQKLAAAVFSLAKKLQPCIIFIDEIDSFLRSRQMSDNEATAMMKAQFMSLWDGFSSGDDIVIVMGATNRPFDLDDAILRRMPTRFPVALPSEKARAAILRAILRNEVTAGDIKYEEIAKYTPKLSGAELKEVCRLAALSRLNKSGGRYDEDLSLTHEDMMESVAKFCSTSTKDWGSSSLRADDFYTEEVE